MALTKTCSRCGRNMSKTERGNLDYFAHSLGSNVCNRCRLQAERGAIREFKEAGREEKKRARREAEEAKGEIKKKS